MLPQAPNPRLSLGRISLCLFPVSDDFQQVVRNGTTWYSFHIYLDYLSFDTTMNPLMETAECSATHLQ